MKNGMISELLILGLALFFIALIFVPTLSTGASPVPTTRRMRKALLTLLPEHLPVNSGDVIYELGSGWGGLAFSVARKYPETTVIGYEVSLLPWLFSCVRIFFLPQDNLHFKLSNFLKHDLSNGVLVVCYLLPKPMEKLRIKLETELKLGSLIVSNTFAFRGWKPIDDQIADDIYASHVFLYKVNKLETIDIL
jgi:hypothetical protein